MRSITPGMTVAGRYTVTGLLGRGGIGGMYRARDIVMNRTVALKVIPAGEAPLSKKSFMTEVKAASALVHPGIVNIYDQLSTEDEYCIVMEYVCGITLREYMDFHGALSLKECLACTRQILGALHAAHSRGIVHRDIKPANIMITTDGRIKVTDFGIARLPGKDGFLMPDRTVGSVHYISPEQAGGRAVDERSDLYSLGIVLYEMLTGCVPFDAERAADVAMMQISTRPTPPSALRRDLPAELEQIVLCALEKDPAARFDSAAAMREILDRLPEDLLLGRGRARKADGEAYRAALASEKDRTGEIAVVKEKGEENRERPRSEKRKGSVAKDAEKSVEREASSSPAVASSRENTAAVREASSAGKTALSTEKAAPPPEKTAAAEEPPFASQRAEQVLGRFTAQDTVDILLPKAGEEQAPTPAPSALPREEDLIRRAEPEEEMPSVLEAEELSADFAEGAPFFAKKHASPRSEEKKTLQKKKQKSKVSSVFDNQGYRMVALIAAAVLLLVLLISLIKKEEPAPSASLPSAHRPAFSVTEVLS